MLSVGMLGPKPVIMELPARTQIKQQRQGDTVLLQHCCISHNPHGSTTLAIPVASQFHFEVWARTQVTLHGVATPVSSPLLPWQPLRQCVLCCGCSHTQHYYICFPTDLAV